MFSRKNLNVCLAVLVYLAVSSGPATFAVTHYVNPGDSIQDAIDVAVNGDEIEVAPGTYLEAIDFKGMAVHLYSSGGPGITIINGNSAYHVVQCVTGEGSGTILDGFTITGGNANGSWPNERGGGMRNHESSPTVLNCIFIGNTAIGVGGGMSNKLSSPTVIGCTFEDNSGTLYGGGMHNDTSNPTVTDCTFTGNTTDGSGGGMISVFSSPVLTNCTFTANTANNGGGMSSTKSNPTVTGCTFELNSSADYGGGMYNYQSDTIVINCTFNNNMAGVSGGGMGNNGSSPNLRNCIFTSNNAWRGGGILNDGSSPTVTNCIFTSNAGDYGGGMYNAYGSNSTVSNCTFESNNAPWFGGGMLNDWESSPTVTNCRFTSNTGGYGGGMFNGSSGNATVTNCTFINNSSPLGGGIYNLSNSCTVTNCILWGNTSAIVASGGTPTVTCSDVQGGWTGTGNIDLDPLFADTDGRLSSGSPCIDAGDDSVVTVITDLDGNPRIQGLCVDMGAFEVGPETMLDGLETLILTEVALGNVDPDMEVSLLAKVNAAIEALNRGNPNDAKVAMNDLKALVNQVDAQTDKKITAEAADVIIGAANQIIAVLGG